MAHPRFRRRGRGAVLLTAGLSLTVAATGIAGAAEPPADPHANGTPITLSGTDDPAQGRYDFPSNLVYGGGNNLSPPLDSTDLTVDATARTHTSIFGGNQNGPMAGPTKLTYNGARPDLTSTAATGYQAYFLVGGNQNGEGRGGSVTMNDGWVRGWVLGGGQSPSVGDTSVTMNGGLIGPPPNATETVGQAEIYGGGIDNGTLQGDTHVTVDGDTYDADTYQPGDRATLVRQHVLGGGSSGAVVTGDTHVNIKGGTVMGQVLGGPGGGGVANNVVGDTHVDVSGGVLTTRSGSAPGGSVFGGGYAAQQNVTGNTHVGIHPGAFLTGSVYGGGYAGPYSIQANTVSGDAETVVDGGHIGANLYAGSMGLSRVNGDATVRLKGIGPENDFVDDFDRAILRGGIGSSGTANTVFDGQTGAYNGTVGTTGTGQMDTIRFINGTRMAVTPSKFNGRDWTLADGSRVDVAAAGTMSSRTFTNAGLLRLNNPSSPDQLHSTIGGNYLSDGGTLAMSATTDDDKNFLDIDQSARTLTRAARAPGGPTTIDLDLARSWDGNRIDLVRSAAPSESGAFTMQPIPIANDAFHGRAVLKSEANEAGGITWYIEGEPDPLYNVVVHHGTLPGGLTTDDFYAGDTVELRADEPAEGQRFSGWRIDSGGPLPGIDLSAANTTFTMPANNVEVTALFEPIPSPTPTPTPPPTPTPTEPSPTSAAPAPTASSGGPTLPDTGASTLLPLGLTAGLLTTGAAFFAWRHRGRRGEQ